MRRLCAHHALDLVGSPLGYTDRVGLGIRRLGGGSVSRSGCDGPLKKSTRVVEARRRPALNSRDAPSSNRDRKADVSIIVPMPHLLSLTPLLSLPMFRTANFVGLVDRVAVFIGDKMKQS